MSDFHLDAAQVQAAIGCFSRGKSLDFDFAAAVMALRKACVGRPDLLRIFLEIQLRASIAGSDLRGPARAVLMRVAAMLGVGAMEFAHMEAILRLRAGRAGARPGDGAGAGRAGQGNAGPAALSLAQAYEILEVDAKAADEDVIKSYRRQLSRHHPDKLKANGLPESMLEHAKQRTQQIIEAWDVIRAERGLR
jgi:DnaJ like chaperone protein